MGHFQLEIAQIRRVSPFFGGLVIFYVLLRKSLQFGHYEYKCQQQLEVDRQVIKINYFGDREKCIFSWREAPSSTGDFVTGGGGGAGGGGGCKTKLTITWSIFELEAQNFGW